MLYYLYSKFFWQFCLNFSWNFFGKVYIKFYKASGIMNAIAPWLVYLRLKSHPVTYGKHKVCKVSRNANQSLCLLQVTTSPAFVRKKQSLNNVIFQQFFKYLNDIPSFSLEIPIINFVEGLFPLASEAHCGYPSLHKYVFTIFIQSALMADKQNFVNCIKFMRVLIII